MTIVSLSGDYDIIRRMHGYKELITDYNTYEILQYLSYKTDFANFEKRMHDNIMRKTK